MSPTLLSKAYTNIGKPHARGTVYIPTKQHLGYNDKHPLYTFLPLAASPTAATATGTTNANTTNANTTTAITTDANTNNASVLVFSCSDASLLSTGTHTRVQPTEFSPLTHAVLRFWVLLKLEVHRGDAEMVQENWVEKKRAGRLKKPFRTAPTFSGHKPLGISMGYILQ